MLVFHMLLAIFVVEEDGALQQILVVGIDAAADVAGGIDPLAGFDVDGGTDQTDWRAAIVNLDQSPLRLVVINLFAGQLAERAELDEQRTDLGGIALHAFHRAGLQVDEDVGHAGWRVERRKQAVPEIVGEVQQALSPVS